MDDLRGWIPTSMWRCFSLVAMHLALTCGFVSGAALDARASAQSWPAVGRVNIKGQSFCTGTLIAPTRVLTAAHCLFHPPTGKLAPLDEIHFVAGWDRGDFVAHAQPTAVYLAAGYRWEDRRSVQNLERDMAILEFGRPVAAPALPVVGGDGQGSELAIVHYSRLKPHLVIVSEGCGRLAGVGKLWLLNCDVEPGGSGAPVLVRDASAGGVTAIAIARLQRAGRWVTLALPTVVPTGLSWP